jgi:hypothetical protein
MAVYCVPREDEDIFNDMGEAKLILLAGCPTCT